MDSKAVRQKFLNYFMKQQHQVVKSAPLVNKDDPTLMFTNAGMNQFKDYFLGNEVPKSKRITDTQKCLRVSGKHNDLEEVGLDTYHHTMFEMLGNWSFGDYFKKEAIEWAWELLTVEFGLPKDRLYVTVFEGDKKDGLNLDQEAYDYWEGLIDQDRILYGSKADNFWEMGDVGPCGPCSEIHIDLRTEEEVKQTSGKELVNMDHPQVVEVWNLVFMEFNRKASGELEPLPEKHIDTGMGFERLCMAIQNKKSNYETDIFTPLIDYLGEKAGKRYGNDEHTDIALRVIADHVRAIAFAIADGQLPSNTGAGYVIRRILRRAVRYGFTFLNFKEPIIYRLVDILDEQMGDVFEELRTQKEFVKKVIQQEESSFLKTLDNGLKRIDQITSSLKAENAKVISGKTAFELYDTFGFPFDLTSLIARENSFSVDEDAFLQEMDKQKTRSKADAVKETGDWTVLKKVDKVEFIGYDEMEAESIIIQYRTLKQKGKEIFQIVLDKTPFYAESGGQVGDNGYLESDSERLKVLDTKKENDLIVHLVEKLPNDVSHPFKAVVNSKKRQLTMYNHTATHLLHHALRLILGTHVEQRGSLVNEKVLRFDFSHFQKMTIEEITQVEVLVNDMVRENLTLEEHRLMPISSAKEMGAMALFGEKYGDEVRVIKFGESVELCGGTHVPATGTIGYFKIVSEGSIASGVRRIEALTAHSAEVYVNEQLEVLDDVKELLKSPADLKISISQLMSEKAQLEKEIQQLHAGKTQDLKKELLQSKVETGDSTQIISKVNVPSSDALKQLSFELKKEVDKLFMVLAADIEGKPQISIVVSEELIESKGLHAGNIVRELAKEIKGGGGGQPFYATAGGKDISGLDSVVEKAKAII